jgi:hypothetical protein
MMDRFSFIKADIQLSELSYITVSEAARSLCKKEWSTQYLSNDYKHDNISIETDNQVICEFYNLLFFKYSLILASKGVKNHPETSSLSAYGLGSPIEDALLAQINSVETKLLQFIVENKLIINKTQINNCKYLEMPTTAKVKY